MALARPPIVGLLFKTQLGDDISWVKPALLCAQS